jgi:hypothetical protein
MATSFATRQPGLPEAGAWMDLPTAAAYVAVAVPTLATAMLAEELPFETDARSQCIVLHSLELERWAFERESKAG